VAALLTAALGGRGARGSSSPPWCRSANNAAIVAGVAGSSVLSFPMAPGTLAISGWPNSVRRAAGAVPGRLESNISEYTLSKSIATVGTYFPLRIVGVRGVSSACMGTRGVGAGGGDQSFMLGAVLGLVARRSSKFPVIMERAARTGADLVVGRGPVIDGDRGVGEVGGVANGGGEEEVGEEEDISWSSDSLGMNSITIYSSPVCLLALKTEYHLSATPAPFCSSFS